MLLTIVHNEIISFDYLKDLYTDDEDFNEEWQKCTSGVASKHQIHDGFLFSRSSMYSTRITKRIHYSKVIC